MGLVRFSLGITKVGYVLFEVGTLLLKIAGQVAVALVFLFALLLYVDFVQTDDLGFELFEITDLVKTLMNVVLELFYFVVLFLKNCTQISSFLSQT